jgi:1-pyrroline-5-carboxylate dehydrogenase
MLKGFFHVPKAVNEPVKGYAPNSPEKQPFKQLTLKCGILKSTCHYISEAKKLELEIQNMSAPHDHKHIVGTYHLAKKSHMRKLLQMH